jgi:hypothetical protein
VLAAASLALLLLASAARAAPGELFISEYVEGSGSNKALSSRSPTS